MMHVTIDKSWTHQNELIFSLISKQMVTYGNIYRCVNTQVSIQTHISLLCWRGVPEKQGHILAMSTLSRSGFSHHSPRQMTDPWRNGWLAGWAGGLLAEPAGSCRVGEISGIKISNQCKRWSKQIHVEDRCRSPLLKSDNEFIDVLRGALFPGPQVCEDCA